MHSDALNGGGEPIVQASDLGLAEHSGAVPLTADQLNLFEGADDAQGLPEQEQPELRRDHEATSLRDTGDDTGRDGGHPSDLPGPAVGDGGAGLDGAVRNDERATGAGEQEGSVPEVDFWIARVPVTHLDRVLQMGGDAGLGRVVEQTADETPQQVYTKLVQGQQQLWTIAEGNKFIGAAVTQLEGRPARVLVVRYLAGADMTRWVHALNDQFLAFAREQQCEAVEAFGREGWRKTLLAMGWAKVAVLYRVAVDG